MPIPTDFAQINWHFEGAGLANPAECTLGIDVSSTTLDPSEIAEVAADAWNSEINPSICDAVTLLSVHVKFGPDDTGPSGDWTGSYPGAVSTTGASSAVAYLLHKRTAFGGRAGSGRMYVPGVPEAQIASNGNLDNTWRGNMNTGFTDLAATLVANNCVPVLLHGTGSPLTTPTPITALEVDDVVATQRRRQRR